MPTPTKGPRLGGGPAHERLMLANLATSLFEHDQITTTEAKAKRLRPLAERLITFAKRGDLHSRRRVLTVVTDKGVVHRLFAEIAPDMQLRPGGYTRITKIGARKGDKEGGGRRGAGRRHHGAGRHRDDAAAGLAVAVRRRTRGARRRARRRGRRWLRSRFGRSERGRLRAVRVRDQGQRRLDEVPRAGRPVVRPDDRRGLLRDGRRRREGGLHQGRRGRRRVGPSRLEHPGTPTSRGAPVCRPSWTA